MGFVSTIVVLNDHLGFIENDPTYGFKVGQAIRSKAGFQLDPPEPIGPGGSMVIESHHTDGTVLVAVGQNSGRVLGSGNETPDDLIVLANVADRLGFKLVKKPVKKTQKKKA